MSRIRKKDLLEIVKQLQDVNEQIDKKGSLIDGLDLAECQELAAKLGEFIENKYSGEDLVESVNTIIHGLEDYCEFIYRMSLAENLSDVNKLHKLSKKIRLTLVNVSNALKNDLPSDRKQVVFLPYKASMWDSLESIWMEAHKDPEVDDFVIPIPYFDRNPDGTFAEMHYEGDQYPDYVPITDWQKYSIPDEKPDVIFIHNPYDDCNFVTSVHPAFYSKELREWTDCLVYVPYFIMDGKSIGREFVENPGIINSDYVVCQTEQEKLFYKKYLTRWLPEHLIEEKLLALGSPKFDKIKNLSSEIVKIPNSWRFTIEEKNPELIVLYNNSVGALLRQDVDKYLSKTLDIFRSCLNSNILVIWRPHPLMKSTLQSMRQGYSNTFSKLEKFFVTNGVGILDQTEDMYSAIFLSDVYIGDWSSVASIYKNSGKPVLLSDENTDRILYSPETESEENISIINRLKEVINKEFYQYYLDFPIMSGEFGKDIYNTIIKKVNDL